MPVLVKSRSRKLISAALVAALPWAAAGCSSSKPTPVVGTSAGAAAHVAAPTKQLTGTQLAGALLGAADVPADFGTDSGSAVDSGGQLSTVAAKYKPASMSCTDLLNDIGKAGFGETAMASDEMENDDSGEMLDQDVYQFASATDANVFFTSLQAKWNSCGTFTEADSSGKVTITAASTPAGLGDMVFANTMSVVTADTTLTGTNMAVLSGFDVFLIGPGKIGTTQPADLSPQALIVKLMTKVAAAG
jgi:hypothetical protein